MVRSMRCLAKDVETGKLSADEITEDVFAGYLDTAGIPDPDLLNSDQRRTATFHYLLWQLAYSEFYFTEVPWPDFDEKELQKADRDVWGKRQTIWRNRVMFKTRLLSGIVLVILALIFLTAGGPVLLAGMGVIP